MDLFGLHLSEIVMIVLINIAMFAMYCIVFLPYLIMDFILIDEMSYKELCIEMSKKKIFTAVVTLVVCVVICVEMSNQGSLELIYNLKH